ncbi:MAG: hypothetical protein R6W96_05625 [Clostridia bacterium]
MQNLMEMINRAYGYEIISETEAEFLADFCGDDFEDMDEEDVMDFLSLEVSDYNEIRREAWVRKIFHLYKRPFNLKTFDIEAMHKIQAALLYCCARSDDPAYTVNLYCAYSGFLEEARQGILGNHGLDERMNKGESSLQQKYELLVQCIDDIYDLYKSIYSAQNLVHFSSLADSLGILSRDAGLFLRSGFVPEEKTVVRLFKNHIRNEVSRVANSDRTGMEKKLYQDILPFIKTVANGLDQMSALLAMRDDSDPGGTLPGRLTREIQKRYGQVHDVFYNANYQKNINRIFLSFYAGILEKESGQLKERIYMELAYALNRKKIRMNRKDLENLMGMDEEMVRRMYDMDKAKYHRIVSNLHEQLDGFLGTIVVDRMAMKSKVVTLFSLIDSGREIFGNIPQVVYGYEGLKDFITEEI